MVPWREIRPVFVCLYATDGNDSVSHYASWNLDLGESRIVMDDGDRGQRITEKLRAWALGLQQNRRQGYGVSLLQCVECGEYISEARRKVQPGCTRCVECQERFEGRDK